MARKKSAAKKAREAGEQKEVTEVKKNVTFEDDEKDIDTLTVNKEYAKRFEHNKTREEAHKLEEKAKARKELEEEDEYGSGSESESSDEDDFGELLTEDVDEGIQKVLETIRTNPKALLNPEVKFFNDPSESVEASEKTSKAIYLKDYHRMNLLEGGTADEEEDEQKPYAIQQREERAKLLAEINNDEDNDDEDFLTKREVQRTIEPVELPNPDQDSKGFLEAYINGKAWIPSTVDKKTGKEIVPSYGDIVANEDDQEFDDIADEFETAYNFRYEDPNAAEIVSYARNESTLRRGQENPRKRAREQKAELRREEETKKKSEVNKVKKQKVHEVLNKFEKKLKEVIDDDETAERFDMDLLEGDFDASEWDKRMEQVFNDEFYSKKDKNIKKDEIEDEGEEEEEEEEPEQEQEQEEVADRRSRKDKHEAKKEKQKLRQVAEQFVEANLDLALEQENVDALSVKGAKFKYRDVSPDSYGLTPRDILIADDKQLNDFVGLKKLASFRDADKKKHDRRKYAKKRRLREWRKSVFQTEDEPSNEMFEKVVVNSIEGEKKNKRKRQ